MPRRDPDTRSAVVGNRVSLRRVRPDGEHGDLIGWVLSRDADRFTLRDRRGMVHTVWWRDVLAVRRVGVARGRDPMRTPRPELDRLAAGVGATGRVFVVRLSDLLDGREPPPPSGPGDPSPQPVSLEGEWASAGEVPDPVALAWWAARADARSLQVRTDSPSVAASLLALGFTER